MAEGDDFRRVQSGDPLRIPAAVYNRLLDSLEGAGPSQGAGTPGVAARSPTVVKVRTSSGADRAQFEVLGLAGPLVTPASRLASFREQVTFDGVLPAAGHAGKFAVLLEPVPQGGIGRAVVAGVVQVQLKGA